MEQDLLRPGDRPADRTGIDAVTFSDLGDSLPLHVGEEIGMLPVTELLHRPLEDFLQGGSLLGRQAARFRRLPGGPLQVGKGGFGPLQEVPGEGVQRDLSVPLLPVFLLGRPQPLQVVQSVPIHPLEDAQPLRLADALLGVRGVLDNLPDGHDPGGQLFAVRLVCCVIHCDDSSVPGQRRPKRGYPSRPCCAGVSQPGWLSVGQPEDGRLALPAWA